MDSKSSTNQDHVEDRILKQEDGKASESNQGSQFTELLGMLEAHSNELNEVWLGFEQKLKIAQGKLLNVQNLVELIRSQASESQSTKKVDDQKISISVHNVSGETRESSHQSSSLPRRLRSLPSEPLVCNLPSAAGKQTEKELEKIKHWVSSDPVRKADQLRAITRSLEETTSFRMVVRQHVQRQYFQIIAAALIISNTVFLGVQVDYTARHEANPAQLPTAYHTIEKLYTLFFVIELSIRLFAYGIKFFVMSERAWNIFDLIVVLGDALQTLLEMIAQEDSVLLRVTSLRILRAFRATRVMRLFRILRFLRELRIMVASIVMAGSSLVWSLVLFGGIIYIFGILILHSVAAFVWENPDDTYYSNYRHYWANLPQSMWTLYSCMTGGVSWMEVGEPLVHINWLYGAFLGFFMFFTIFVVTNIITGVFVDASIQNAQSDRNEMIHAELHVRDRARNQLKIIFDEADHDKSGSLTLAEFEKAMDDERVKTHLCAIGLQVDDAQELFGLLDIEDRAEIGIEEFLFGCMRLKGGATSMDLAMMMFEQKQVQHELKTVHQEIHGLLLSLHDKMVSNATLQTEPLSMDLQSITDDAPLRPEPLSMDPQSIVDHAPLQPELLSMDRRSFRHAL